MEKVKKGRKILKSGKKFPVEEIDAIIERSREETSEGD